jgi:uncharacterized protein YdhG (YjbR/CyaY superfamily)
VAKKEKGKTAKTVDEYIASAPRDMRAALRDLRKAIKSAAPDAEEKISWRMPCYKYHGMLVFFAAFKNHMSFLPASRTTVETYKDKLKGFEISGTTIHFTPEKPLPAALVKQIVRARMQENMYRSKKTVKLKRSDLEMLRARYRDSGE